MIYSRCNVILLVRSYCLCAFTIAPGLALRIWTDRDRNDRLRDEWNSQHRMMVSANSTYSRSHFRFYFIRERPVSANFALALVKLCRSEGLKASVAAWSN